MQELVHRNKQEQQRLLLESMVEAQEKEQRRIAQDLHDEIGPVIAFMKVKAAFLNQSLQHDPELEEISRDVADQLAGVLSRIRRITHDLMPQIVEDLGLVTALEELAREVSSGIGITFTFQSGTVKKPGLNKQEEVTLYRVVQELVHNSLKHGKPRSISLSLTRHQEQLLLRYQDDGAGFAPEELTSRPGAAKGLGLRNVQGRIDLLYGKFELDSALGKGCLVKIQVPIKG